MDKTCVWLWASFQEDTPGHHIKTGMRSQHHLCITSRPSATAGEFLQSSPQQTCWPGTPVSKCSQGCVLSPSRLPWIFSACFFLITKTVETHPWWTLANFRRSSYDSLEMCSMSLKWKQTWACTGKHSFPSFLLSPCEIDYRISKKGPVNSLRWFPIKRHSGSYTVHLSRTAPSRPHCHLIPRKKGWEEKDEWVLSNQLVTWSWLPTAAYFTLLFPNTS